MSAIYFHSKHGDAKVHGSERAYMSCFINDLALSAMGDFGQKHWAYSLLQTTTYLRESVHNWDLKSFSNWFGYGRDSALCLGDETFDCFSLALNTVIAIGNNTVKLMAKLHGQCEIHCWVHGYDRYWLAELIEDSLKSALFREDQGWENVIVLLRERDDGPVICSYSVCEQFPNFGLLPTDHPLMIRTDDGRYDDFDNMDTDEQWNVCFESLKVREPSLAISPISLGNTFHHNEDLLTLRRRSAQVMSAPCKTG